MQVISTDKTNCMVCGKEVSISLSDYCGGCDKLTCPSCDCECHNPYLDDDKEQAPLAA